MIKAAASLLAGILALAATTRAVADEGAIELRAIDRATVRVVSVYGVDGALVEGRETGLARVTPQMRLGHGTGIAVHRAGWVLTARHVVESAVSTVVILPGDSEPVPARVVYVDPDHDVAVLRIPGPVRAVVGLPRAGRRLQMSEQLTASGYPIDVTQRYPAAVSGSLSRVSNDGRLQLAISLNPGNSGGPVIDAREQLVGMAVMRGAVEQGIQGIGFVEPVEVLAAAFERARGLESRPFEATDVELAHLVGRVVEPDEEVTEATIRRVSRYRELVSQVRTPEEAALVATRAWLDYLILLERSAARAPEAVSDATVRASTVELRSIATDLSRRILGNAPYMRVRFPVLQPIAAGRTVPGET